MTFMPCRLLSESLCLTAGLAACHSTPEVPMGNVPKGIPVGSCRDGNQAFFDGMLWMEKQRKPKKMRQNLGDGCVRGWKGL